MPGQNDQPDAQIANEIIAQFSDSLTVSDKEAIAQAGLGEELDSAVAERLCEFFAAGGKKLPTAAGNSIIREPTTGAPHKALIAAGFTQGGGFKGHSDHYSKSAGGISHHVAVLHDGRWSHDSHGTQGGVKTVNGHDHASLVKHISGIVGNGAFSAADENVEQFAAGGKKGGDANSHRMAWATRKAGGAPKITGRDAHGNPSVSTAASRSAKTMAEKNAAIERENAALSAAKKPMPAYKSSAAMAKDKADFAAIKPAASKTHTKFGTKLPTTRSGKPIQNLPLAVIQANAAADRADSHEYGYGLAKHEATAKALTQQHVDSHEGFTPHDHADAAIRHRKDFAKAMDSGYHAKATAHLDAAKMHAEKTGHAAFIKAHGDVARGKPNMRGLSRDKASAQKRFESAKAWLAKGGKK